MSTPNTSVDVVVLGLGIHGSAAAFELADRGLTVIGLEQFEPDHTRGSSHGATRMIRRAYPNPVWNPLVDRAFAGWDRWRDTAGFPFITTTGGLYAHRTPGGLQGPGVVPEPAPAERMAGLSVPPGYSAVFDPAAGVVESGLALVFARSAARARGADLRFGETLIGFTPTQSGVTIETSRGVIHTKKLVVAAGAWIGAVVPELAPFFEVWRIITVTAAAGQGVGQPPSLGTFSIDLPEGLVFGIPDTEGHGVKLGIDAGPVWDPATALEPPTEEEVARLRLLLAELVPELDLGSLEPVACLYTMTPDKRFVVGALPWASDVIVAAACSGHGFKFGPAIGEAVADLCQGIARPDLDFLAVERFVSAPAEASTETSSEVPAELDA